MSDQARFEALLSDRRFQGLHSHEIRRLGISGNPSQRAKDAATHGTPICKARENVGKRPGTRFWLSEFAPDFAVAVTPNRSPDAETPVRPPATGRDLDAESGQLFEMPTTRSAVTGEVVEAA